MKLNINVLLFTALVLSSGYSNFMQSAAQESNAPTMDQEIMQEIEESYGETLFNKQKDLTIIEQDIRRLEESLDVLKERYEFIEESPNKKYLKAYLKKNPADAGTFTKYIQRAKEHIEKTVREITENDQIKANLSFRIAQNAYEAAHEIYENISDWINLKSSFQQIQDTYQKAIKVKKEFFSTEEGKILTQFIRQFNALPKKDTTLDNPREVFKEILPQLPGITEITQRLKTIIDTSDDKKEMEANIISTGRTATEILQKQRKQKTLYAQQRIAEYKSYLESVQDSASPKEISPIRANIMAAEMLIDSIQKTQNPENIIPLLDERIAKAFEGIKKLKELLRFPETLKAQPRPKQATTTSTSKTAAAAAAAPAIVTQSAAADAAMPEKPTNPKPELKKPKNFSYNGNQLIDDFLFSFDPNKKTKQQYVSAESNYITLISVTTQLEFKKKTKVPTPKISKYTDNIGKIQTNPFDYHNYEFKVAVGYTSGKGRTMFQKIDPNDIITNSPSLAQALKKIEFKKNQTPMIWKLADTTSTFKRLTTLLNEIAIHYGKTFVQETVTDITIADILKHATHSAKNTSGIGTIYSSYAQANITFKLIIDIEDNKKTVEISWQGPVEVDIIIDDTTAFHFNIIDISNDDLSWVSIKEEEV